jgi:hypothetical protein
MAPRNDLEGQRLLRRAHNADDDEVYLVLGGVARLIPDLNRDDLQGMVFKDDDVLDFDHVGEVEEGPGFGQLYLGLNHRNGAVFLVDCAAGNPTRRVVTSPEAMDRYHFDFRRVEDYSFLPGAQMLLMTLPFGAPMSIDAASSDAMMKQYLKIRAENGGRPLSGRARTA